VAREQRGDVAVGANAEEQHVELGDRGGRHAAQRDAREAEGRCRGRTGRVARTRGDRVVQRGAAILDEALAALRARRGR
jgi:hypothetical protein